MEYVYLLVGFAALILCGHFLVKGAVSIAGHFKISTLVVGITIVSLGTSAPELFVSIQAALNGHPDISLGNVIGSNISNIALVLALTVVLIPMTVKRSSVVFDWPVMFVVSILFYLFILNNRLDLWEGIVFVIFLIAYNYWSIYRSRKKNNKLDDTFSTPQYSLWISILIVITSSLGLVFGADWMVKGAVEIASKLGVSERIISVSLIAIGTSLPELATSIIAAINKESDISVGNIIGSNVFNILAVLGISSIITPIQVNDKMIVSSDILWMLGISALLFLFILPFKGGKLFRWKGLIMLLVYATYMYLLIESN